MKVKGEKRGRGAARGKGWTAEWEWEERWTVEEDSEGPEEGPEAEEAVGEVRREGRDFRKQEELRERRGAPRPPTPSPGADRLGRGAGRETESRSEGSRGERLPERETPEGHDRGTDVVRAPVVRGKNKGIAPPPRESRGAEERGEAGVAERVEEEREERRRRVEWAR